MDIKKSLKDVIVLLVICVVFTGILAVTNSVTAPIIADRLNAAANEAYFVVMPDAKGFDDVDISGYTLPATITEVKKESSGLGYVVKVETKGYANGLVIVVGVSNDGKIIHSVCIANSETPSKIGTLLNDGDYNVKFDGKNLSEVAGVDTVAGVTYTTQGYKSALSDAINTVTILGGGEVDLRDPEQILKDNLMAALPSGGEAFTEMFMIEVVEGVDKIYVADNNAGYVCVIGEGSEAEFIGVEGGVALGDSSNKAIAEAAVAIVSASDIKEIDISEFANSTDRNIKKIFRSITAVSKTASGNYVVVANVKGYATDMIIKTSISADGIIIDTVCVSSNETNGAEKTYGDNFIGKSKDQASGVDTITGSTMTTDGYKLAISNSFSAINIVETSAEGGTN